MGFEVNENIEHLCKWIKDRHDVFEKKNAGEPFPWTDNKIISSHKFTNVFRVLDRESQFLIREVIGDDNMSIEDTTFRILLFKHFNFQSTWEFLESRLGKITYRDGILLEIRELLDEYAKTNKVYSSAYLQAANFVRNHPWKHLKGTGKHNCYLTVFEAQLFNSEDFFNFIAYSSNSNLEDLINKLQEIDGVGNFMAYQFAQDLNYSHWWNQDMNSITFEGPGSIRGVHRCFNFTGKPDYNEVIKWTLDNLDYLFEHFNLGSPPKFEGMPIQLTDMQNCFCESDKYMRGLGIVVEGVSGKSIKQKYKSGRNVVKPILPKKLKEKWQNLK